MHKQRDLRQELNADLTRLFNSSTSCLDGDLLWLDELVELSVLALLDGGEGVGDVVQGQNADVERTSGAAGTLKNDASNVVVSK